MESIGGGAWLQKMDKHRSLSLTSHNGTSSQATWGNFRGVCFFAVDR